MGTSFLCLLSPSCAWQLGRTTMEFPSGLGEHHSLPTNSEFWFFPSNVHPQELNLPSRARVPTSAPTSANNICNQHLHPSAPNICTQHPTSSTNICTQHLHSTSASNISIQHLHPLTASVRNPGSGKASGLGRGTQPTPKALPKARDSS